MNFKKKILSIVLSFSMIITMFPYSVFAAGEEPAADIPTGTEAVQEESGAGASETVPDEVAADDEAAADEVSDDVSDIGDQSAPKAEKPASKETDPTPSETETVTAEPEKETSGPAETEDDTEVTIDTALSLEYDEKAEGQFEDGRILVRVTASNSNTEQGAATARLYFWDYDKDFFDKDKRDDVKVMNEQVTVDGLDDEDKVALDNGTSDAKSVDAELKTEKDARYIEFEVPADTEYDFDLPLVIEDETAEKPHIIVEPVVVGQDEDSEAVSEPLELDWEAIEKSETDKEQSKDGEFADEGQTLVLDKSALRNIDKTWAEAEGKFSLKAAGGSKGPLKAAGVNGFADYEPYMTVHTLKQDGRTITNGSTIDPESNFQLQLQFKLDFDDMIANGTKYSYRLPANVSVGDVGSPTQQVTLYNSRQVAIGTYYIKDDVMFVTFPGYYDEVVANFSMSASWTGTEGKSEIKVPWNGKTETYLINNCQLKIFKNSTGYKTDDEGNLYNHYKVTIKPEEDNLSVGGVTLKDTMSQTRMKLYEDYFGAGNDVLVTVYDGNNRVAQTQYYEADGNKIKTSPVSLDIGTYTIPAGGRIVVEYAGKIDKADRLNMDAHSQNDNYYNTAVASQDWRNPTTGQIEHPSVETVIKGNYSNDSSWVLKEAGDDTKTKKLDGDTVTVVPYTVTLNKYRRYSLGGGAVTDAITDFDGGDVKKDVRYDTSGANGVAPYIIATDKNGERTINQRWVILDDDVWNELRAAVSSTGSIDVTQLDKLNQNTTLVRKMLEAAGESGSTLTNELAEKLIFTASDAHNFVWFMPKDSTPTTYTIYYFTLVGSEVGSFKNSASMWYTLYEGVPGGPGQGWVRPVKRVMNATKTNEGVYIGADGNFYVDYTITVGLERGSAGFEDIFIKDALPNHRINGIDVYDWIAGMEEDALPLARENAESRTARKRALNSAISISSDSTDPRVQEVVNRSLAFLGRARENPNSSPTFRNEQIVSYTTNETSFADIDSAAQGALYKTPDSRPAGQFFADGHAGNGTNVPIDKGDTYSLTWMMFWLGDLPGTEEGYDITFKYTMQVNPYLVENLAGHLEEIGKDYVTLSNTATVGTSIVSNNGKTKRLEFSGITPRNAGYIGEATTSYWIGATRPTDYVTKDVKSYDKDSRLLLYDVTINEEGQLDATDKKYVIEDQLNINGLRYKANSLTLKDAPGADGKVIWTNDPQKSVDAAYRSMDSSFNVTDNDNKVNSFTLVLDNKDGHLTDSNGKLKKMYMEYGVDFNGSDSDVTLMNTVSLRLRGSVSDTDSNYDKLIDEATSEYAVDKAVDKHFSRDPDKQPSAANNYTASYYIIVDPTSTNAYELGDIRAGETFTVKDTLSDSLLLNIDGVKVEQTLNGRTTDITGSCGLAYDVNDNVFEATIPVTDPTATYRIDYEAFVKAEAMTVVRLSNTAEISGTHVKPDTVKEKVRIYEYDESASASTYGIRLKKFDSKDIETKLSATFDLYEYNTTSKAWDLLTTGIGNAKRITTNNEGYIKIDNGLSENFRYIKADTWYKLVEAVPPEGYMLDDTPTYYYVSTDGEVKVSIPQDNSKDIERYSVLVMPEQGATEEEFPLLYVSDSKLEFRILKTDKATDEPLEGAEFEVYTDPECTERLDKQTTDADGRIQFENLQVPTTVTLYLKETVTPENYIPNEDKVYTLNFVDGLLSGDVIDQDGNKLTYKKEGFESLLTVTNTSKTGRLEVQKTVNADVAANKTKNTFAFVIKLTDAEGTELSEPVKLITVTQDGEESEGTYRSGSILEIKHEEKAILPELPDGTLYEVTEVVDNMYSTTVQIADTMPGKKGDTQSAAAGYEAQGTILTGEADTVKYANTLLDTLIVKKQVVAENGDELNIPDGHTLMIKSKGTSNEAYLTAIWNEAAGEYELSKRSSDSIGFYTTTEDGEPIEGGFRVTGLPKQSDNTYYVEESHATISGYTYVLTGASDTNPNVVSVDVRNKDVTSKTLINTYTVKEDSAEAEVRALKILEGQDLTKDQFSFVLFQKMGITGYSKIVQSTTNSKSGRIEFDTLYFNSAGTYYYQIKEVKPGNADENIEYQETPIYVKIVVLSVNGKLIANDPVYSPVEDGDSIDPIFTNKYITKETTASLEAQKKMSGKSADESAFTLKVREVQSDYETAVTNESGDPVEFTKTTPAIEKDGTVTVEFDPMTFTEVGDHYYVINEDVPSGVDEDDILSGIHYDRTTYRAKVSVAESGNNLVATVTYMDKDGNVLTGGKKPLFVNSYVAKGDITFNGTKSIDKRDLQEGDVFTFTIKEGNNVVDQANNDASTGVISYPEIEYVYDDEHRTGVLGEHTYTITEENSTVSHVTKSSTTYTVKVNVTDDGAGNLTATVTEGDKDKLDFINTYEASGYISLDGVKKISGRSFKQGDKWKFNIERDPDDEASAAAPLPSTTYVEVEPSSGTSVAFEFGQMNYTAADIGKTYRYVISEDTGVTVDGVINDPNRKVVTVTVEDAGDGELDVTADYGSADANAVEFTNTYASNSVELSGNKSITGRSFKAGDKWKFNVTAITPGAPEPEQTSVTIEPTADDGKTKSFTFGEINFSLSDLNGEASKVFRYEVTEDASVNVENVTNDPAKKIFEVKVTDKGSEGLDIETTEASQTISFTNTYKAEGKILFEGTKKLTGRPLTADDIFTFTITENGKEVGTGTSDSTGKITFSEIRYKIEGDTEGVTGEHTYVVSENPPEDSTITCKTQPYTVTVTVSDDGSGKLSTSASQNYKKLDFENAYSATGSITFNGSKTMRGRNLNEGETYSFSVTETVDGRETVVATGTSDDTGKITYTPINYSEQDIGTTHTYTVKETSQNADGVVVDTNKHTIVVRVDNAGNGKLDPVVVSGDKDKVDFVNEYHASGEIILKGLKAIEGRDFKSGDKWSFTLARDPEDAASKNAPLPDNTTAVIEPSQGTTSGFSFDSISFTEEHIGKTYKYIITEDPSVTVSGVINDPNAQAVVVTISDAGKGKLTVDAFYGDNQDTAEFVNSYASGSVEIKGSKAITGRSYTAGDKWQFNITANDEDAPPLEKNTVIIQPTAADAKNVEFSLGTFRYQLTDLKGQNSRTFTYTITESGTVQGVTNDRDTDRTLKLVVTNAGNGKLNITVASDSEPITFTNDYKATGQLELKGTKSIDKRDLKSGDVFRFTVKEGNKVVSTGTSNENTGVITYEPISYELSKEKDETGNHTYTVSEDVTDIAGITKSSKTYTVKVNVSDNKNGTLKVEKTSGSDDPEKLDFVNEYKAVGTLELKGTKKIDCRDLVDTDKFTYTVKEGDKVVSTGTSDKTGVITYEPISYELSKDKDETGEHTYTVTENSYDANGVKSSSESYTVTVNVSDNKNGTLKVEKTSGTADPQKLDFENAYTATGDITFAGIKAIDCRELNVDGEHDVFEFTITGPDGYSETVKNDADGKIAYPKLEYIFDKDHPNALGDYTYTVTEKTTTQGGITKDSREYTVVVNVADNTDGTLAVTAKSVKVSGTGEETASDTGDDTTQPADGDNSEIALTEKDLNFVNTYEATGEYTFEGMKSIDTRDLTSGESYKFTVQEQETQGSDAGKTFTAASDDSGKIDYPTIGFELNKDRNDLGTHTYTISEETVDADGITSSTKKYTVKLTVTDNEDGTLKVETAEGSDDPSKLDFENHYEATGSTHIEVTKLLEGRKWNGSDSFSFELKGLNGAPMPGSTAAGSDTKIITIDKDSAYEGSVYTETFGDISFSMDDLKTNGKYVSEKTFEYEIRELAPDVDNIEYDENTYKAVVTVTDDKKGTLKTSVKFYLNGEEVSPTGKADDGDACVTGRGGLQITNKYVPEDEKKGVKTGDDSGLAGWLALLLMSLTGCGGTAVYRRRRRED